MRFAAGAAPFEALLIGALLVVPIATAYADENGGNDVFSVPRAQQIVQSLEKARPAESWFQSPADLTSSGFRKAPEREILFSLDGRATQKSWIRTHFHLTTKYGLEYRHEFSVGEQKLRLKLYGPIVKKKPGMGVQLHGLTVADHKVTIKAYGNTRKGGIGFKFDF